MDNSIKFISLLSENNVINNYMSSFFNGEKLFEEEIIKKYGDVEGNILISLYNKTFNKDLSDNEEKRDT